jgi:NarL family two-component system response regulator LiaR
MVLHAPSDSRGTRPAAVVQRGILQLIAEGHSTKKIAYLLKISTKTVEAHRGQLMERLHIYDVTGLVRYAIHHGLATLDG